MSLQQQIEQDLITALKAKDETGVNTLRYLKSALQNKEIELKKKELSDQQVGEVVASEVKKRKESIAEFKKGGRDDLVKQEEAELRILQEYQPEQLSEEELGKMVDQAISETGASGPADTGKVMGSLMPKVKGKADGALVARLVGERLKK